MASKRSRKQKRGVSYKAGEKGRNRVRLFSHPRDGTLYVEYRVGPLKKRIALGHTDEQLGKQAAEALAVTLREHEAPSGPVTLRSLFEKYEQEVTPLKGAEKQRHDVSTRLLFERCWGPTLRVKDLDRKDWDRFITLRRSGKLRSLKSFRKGEVGERAIAYDLKHLRAVIRWAQGVREGGRPLLEGDPTTGFPMPSERSPKRPALSDDEYNKLEEAAEGLGGTLPLFLLMVHETGHRCSAVGSLKWSDVDLTTEEIHWRKESDKIGNEHRTPLSKRAVNALRDAQKDAMSIGDAWVFPSPEDISKPFSRHHLRDLWRKLEKASGIERRQGRGWHSLRRKFATERMYQPLKALCVLGGWKNSGTVVDCYQQPTGNDLREVLENRTLRFVGT